jgi:pimeloyl-ACP methyl ester carboxylesterase
VATFALIHGGGGSAWDWHLVAPELRERGHEPVAVDLPCGAWARRHARERLDVTADEMDGGHYISLSRPRELAERLHAYAVQVAGRA